MSGPPSILAGLRGYPNRARLADPRHGRARVARLAAVLDVPQVQERRLRDTAFDTLTRLSLVLGIYKSLQVLYPDVRFADGWPRMPNTHGLFGGRAPVEFLTGGGIDALFQVRRLLDGRRG